MKLNELFESADEVAVIFGRFNPPHQGHKAAWEMMSQSSNWYVGTNSSTQGPKDPLPFDIKVEAMKSIYPNIEGHLMSSQSWLTMASELYEKHLDAKLIVYTDEDWVIKALKDYNGVGDKPHGFYSFSSIEQQPTPRLSSATALRDAVKAGDREAFSKAAGIPADTKVAGKPYFDLVAEYLLPYAEKEAAKAAKKKKSESFDDIEEGWKSKMAGAALAAANLLSSPAQAAEEPVKPITVAYVMIDGEVRSYNLGDKFNSAKEAEKFISNVLDQQGLSGYTLDIKHGYPKKKDKVSEHVAETIRKVKGGYRLYSKDGKKNLGTYPSRAGAVKREKQVQYFKHAEESIQEAPIEMDPSDPMDPMIYGHDKANPAKLKYRMLRAAGQLKDLAARAEKASPSEWQIMARQFEELKMNMEQIRHALEELGKMRKKGGIRSRGIDPMIDSIEEGYGRYYCSTDKKWKTRKGPKQSRKS